jgi:ubiquinone/menaquinone biosynthesis C-methylase UbiE
MTMAEPEIRFNDGAGYERLMGTWSRIAGEIFLDWLAPAKGLKWIDVGCGNGAFTELIVDRCAPVEVVGFDPSEGQLSYARTRPAARLATFRQGDAMALPVDAGKFDVAVMALVIFFVPAPAKGVAEMVRVVRPGGTIAAYAWDTLGGGFPLEPIHAEMRALGLPIQNPPSVEASRIDAMRELWKAAGLVAVETREISVTRTFADFEEFWETAMLSNSMRPMIADRSPEEISQLQQRVRARLQTDSTGQVTVTAFANAAKGTVPK